MAEIFTISSKMQIESAAGQANVTIFKPNGDIFSDETFTDADLKIGKALDRFKRAGWDGATTDKYARMLVKVIAVMLNGAPIADNAAGIDIIATTDHQPRLYASIPYADNSDAIEYAIDDYNNGIRSRVQSIGYSPAGADDFAQRFNKIQRALWV